jgi:hypothetical protein
LLDHLKQKGIRAYRCKRIAEIESLNPSTPKPAIDDAAAIQRGIEILRGLEKSNCGPRTVKKLKNTLCSKVPNTDPASLIKALQKQKLLTISEKKVSYHFQPK